MCRVSLRLAAGLAGLGAKSVHFSKLLEKYSLILIFFASLLTKRREGIDWKQETQRWLGSMHACSFLAEIAHHSKQSQNQQAS